MSDDLERIAATVHEAWIATKRAQGFHYPAERHPSERMDAATFTKLPCDWCRLDMVPYDALSEADKDLNRATVRAVLDAQRALREEGRIA